MGWAARPLLSPAMTASALVHGGAIAALAMVSLPAPPPAAPIPAFQTVTLTFVAPPLPPAQASADPVPAPPQPAAQTAVKPLVKAVAKPVPRPEAKPAPIVTEATTSTAASETASSTVSTPTSASAGAAETPPQPQPLPVVLNPDYLSPPDPPVYPSAARRLQIEGTVVVRALVERPGHPSEVTLWRSSGESLLDRSALEAVRFWRFRPMTHSGGTVAAWVEIPVTFSISNS